MTSPRDYNPKKILIALCVLAVLVIYPYLRAARQPNHYEFGGSTMGTYYVVKVRDSSLGKRDAEALQGKVEDLLKSLSDQMSTYDPASEISRFNSTTQVTAIAVSPDFARVADFSRRLAHLSGGAFDPTILPLLAVWGFGPEGTTDGLPAAQAVTQAMERVGYRHLTVTPPDKLRKTRGDLHLDLNAVAKGYAVHRVAELVRDEAGPNVFVDIGGEIQTFGFSAKGTPWRVGIEVPDRGAMVGAGTLRTLPLSGRAVATSGDYRNYFLDSGRAYSHIIDARTGYPVSNGVASVSVTAPDCMTADALATALMVLGVDEGFALLEHYPGTEVLFVLRQEDGSYELRQSDGFAP